MSFTIVGKYQKATENWERERLRNQLGTIADGRRSGIVTIVGDGGADRDEALELLLGYGTFSAADLFAASRGLITEPKSRYERGLAKYERGLSSLGISYGEQQRLLAGFKQGRIPVDVIDAVLMQADEIHGLHPDKYPWHVSASDDISSGILAMGFNTRRIWNGIEKHFAENGRSDLVRSYRMEKPAESLTVLLEHYALTKYDIRQLNVNGREVHF